MNEGGRPPLFCPPKDVVEKMGTEKNGFPKFLRIRLPSPVLSLCFSLHPYFYMPIIVNTGCM
jgi:hypothetical protein